MFEEFSENAVAFQQPRDNLRSIRVSFWREFEHISAYPPVDSVRVFGVEADRKNIEPYSPTKPVLDGLEQSQKLLF